MQRTMEWTKGRTGRIVRPLSKADCEVDYSCVLDHLAGLGCIENLCRSGRGHPLHSVDTDTSVFGANFGTIYWSPWPACVPFGGLRSLYQSAGYPLENGRVGARAAGGV